MRSTAWDGWQRGAWLLRLLVVAVVLGGLPILLHGCHGDEDNELLAPLFRHLLTTHH